MLAGAVRLTLYISTLGAAILVAGSEVVDVVVEEASIWEKTPSLSSMKVTWMRARVQL